MTIIIIIIIELIIISAIIYGIIGIIRIGKEGSKNMETLKEEYYNRSKLKIKNLKEQIKILEEKLYKTRKSEKEQESGKLSITDNSQIGDLSIIETGQLSIKE